MTAPDTVQEPKPQTSATSADKKAKDDAQDWQNLYPKWTTVKLTPVKPEFSLRVDGRFYQAALAVAAEFETGKTGRDGVDEFAKAALKEFLANPASRKQVTLEERNNAQVAIPGAKQGTAGKVVSVELTKDDGITPADLAKKLMARYGQGEEAKATFLREALALKLKAAYAKHAGQ